jgi:hypothetical protein
MGSKMIGRWTASWMIGATCLTLAGCVVPSSAPPPPPPLQAEVMSKPPVTTTPLLWQPGHWDWTGGGYVWQPGEYVPSAGHGNMYMPGFWAATPDGRWVWQPAHWM